MNIVMFTVSTTSNGISFVTYRKTFRITLTRCRFRSYDATLSLMHIGEDCDTCGPKVTSAEDVKDVDMPEWKKKALAAGVTADAGSSTSPESLNWNTEGHDHSHGHS